MKASALLPELTGSDFDVSAITDDSRQVGPGSIYVALSGTKNNGADYVCDAVSKGALCVVAKAGEVKNLPANIRLFEAADPRVTLAEICKKFYQPRPEIMAAVTGTDGKTSTAHFTRQIWENAEIKSASIGTIGVRGKFVPADIATDNLANTTPGMVSLSLLLQKLARADVHNVVMEASSHGLDQRRLDELDFKAAAFTNLTRDHLDYHGTVEEYFKAKARLFSEKMSANGVAIINRDDARYDDLVSICAGRGIKIISFGECDEADLRLDTYKPHSGGAEITISCFGKKKQLDLNLIGRFQIMNIMAAAGIVHGCGLDIGKAFAGVENISGVPGRLETAAVNKAGAAILVDYAHTPAALENMLKTVREHVSGKLVVVFGCGGDRDAGKRPLMAAAASKIGDFIVVTDDNPRSENPADIRRAVLAGIDIAKKHIEIGDRADAIKMAIAEAGKGDVVVIAGKGHEKEQIIGDKKIPFDDVAIAREYAGGKL